MHHKHEWNTTLVIVCVCLALNACSRKQSDPDAIRAGITQHLASMRGLNVGAMDMELNAVSIQGKQAHAQVTFRPKGGAPSGGGMQVAYDLEEQDTGWVVVKTGGLGGDHPASNAPGPAPPNSVHGDLPNFRDMLTPAKPDPTGVLSPGHPPVTTPAKPNADVVKE